MSNLDEHLENQANERSEMHDEEKRKPGTKIKPALKDKKEKMAKKILKQMKHSAYHPFKK